MAHRASLATIVRLIRAARESTTDSSRGLSPWGLMNLNLLDNSGAFPPFDISPLATSTKLEVLVREKGDSSAVVTERWKISVGGANDDADSASANAVLVHALYAYLRVGELYGELCRSAPNEASRVLKVQIQDPAQETAPMTAAWERRSWSIPDGISVQVWFNRLWRRELADVTTSGSSMAFLQGQREESATISTPSSTPPITSGSLGANPLGSGGGNSPVPPLTTGPIPKSGSPGVPATHTLVPPLSLASKNSPGLGPSDPPVGSIGSVRTASLPTPPFVPSSFPVGSFGQGSTLLGHSPGPVPMDLPPSAVNISGVQPGGGGITNSSANFAALPAMVPLVGEEESNNHSPVGRKNRQEDGFLALIADERGGGGESEEAQADCGTFMIACDECVLQRRKVNVHDYVDSAASSP